MSGVQTTASTNIKDSTAGAISTEDLIVDLATKGLVLKDTQATPHYWRLTATTLGVLVTTDLGTAVP